MTARKTHILRDVGQGAYTCHSRSSSAPTRRGATLVLVAVLMTVLLGVGAMALDWSRMYSFKAEVRRAADAAAMSAIYDWKHGASETTAEANVATLANTVEGSNSVLIGAANITAVRWNFTTKTWVAADSWPVANAVRVTASYNASWTLGRVFGASTRTVNATTIAAIGFVGESDCLKPIAISYASLLSAAGYGSPADTAHELTSAELGRLISDTTQITFGNAPGTGAQTGKFAWVKVTGRQNNSENNIVDALNGCASIGMGVGSTITDMNGKNGSQTQSALQNLCGGATTCNSANPPILVPIYSQVAAGNYVIKMIGALQLTAISGGSLVGYLTAVTQSGTTTPGNIIGPIMTNAVIVN